MATKKQEILPEEQAPMEEAVPQTEENPELEEMIQEEMHDAADAESPPPQTETEISETDGNSADPGSLAEAEGASPQTETEAPKKTRGRKKTAEKASESDIEADAEEKNAGDGVEEAPKPRRRRASARPKPVVSIDERPTVETEADKAKNDLLDLLESQKTGRILTGTIQGVERPADNPSRSLAVIYHGEFKVIIPAEEAVEPPDDYRGRLPEDVLHYMLTKRLGAEVDYIVKGIDPKSGLAVASRLEAMKAKRKAYYLGTDRDGNNLLYSGVCAEARIVSVIRAGIFVDLFGLEIYIPLRELSYQRWMDAAAYFQPGQRILVKVLEVDRSDRNRIKATASVKQAGENPYEKALRRYSVGNRYVGTVSMVDTNGVFVALDGGIDCLCSYPKRGRPPRGSRVTVRILGINNDSNRIWGAITHIAAAR
ncbi:S1 RNA-binding domain-containing protein [Longicatena caecimuris]|uniref:S1 RNA-binding domain-containing protein n=1 Tax=Longicatena caecimuris TaxID=1796635 RepID=UPI001D011B35|nr:S1 RNA-binding domain-containing protein [Longicatena caecimuris]MCB5393393.1 S1 RNA-binding domain-containing protein [Longicatena caecimuris]MCB5564348.1 S1 RNA-binding domain-containing protein [Longicatena caecimuris]